MASDPLNNLRTDPLGGPRRQSDSGGGSQTQVAPTKPPTVGSTLSQYNVGDIGSQSLSPVQANQPSTNAPVAYQSITGTSLDQMLRSIQNLLSGQGFSTFNSGSNVFGSGLDTTQAGLNLQQQPLDFWSAVLSGDPSASKFINQAISPEVSSIGSQYATAATNARQNTPQGGYRASEMASLPFAQARDVSGLYSQFANLVPQAAQQISSIGQGISSTGLSAAGLGATEQQLGLSQLFQVLNNLLSQKGLDIGQQESNMANLVHGLESVFSAIVP